MTVLSKAPSTGGRRQWQAFAAAGLIAAVLYVWNVSAVVSMAAFAVIGVGTIWACFVGPRRFGAEPRTAWLSVSAAALLFLIGVVIRPDGTQIITVVASDGRLLRRIRRDERGREIIIIDNSYRDPRAVGGFYVEIGRAHV